MFGRLSWRVRTISTAFLTFAHTLVVVTMPNQVQDLHTVDTSSFSYIFEQNASVKLKSSDGLIRLNVYRPKSDEKVPVLVTYGPYVPHKSYDGNGLFLSPFSNENCSQNRTG